jgi:hypothetical protein
MSLPPSVGIRRLPRIHEFFTAEKGDFRGYAEGIKMDKEYTRK